MTISIVYSIMTTIRVGGAKSCPEGTCGNYNALIWLKKIFSGLIRPLKSVGCPKKKFWGYLEAFFEGYA